MVPPPLLSPIAYQFPSLLAHSAVMHFVSGRGGGVSEGPWTTLNLGLKAGDNPQHVIENRRRIAHALDLQSSQLIFPAQTHSCCVQIVDQDTSVDSLTETDALITSTPGLCLCVLSADCVPILLYDPVQRVVGAVHAGWRGTVSQLLTRTVETMRTTFGTQPAHLLAGIGPSISPAVYEVGTEVINAVEKSFGGPEGLLTPSVTPGKAFFNLWEANRRQLHLLGVPTAAIEIAYLCTYQNHDQFFSARWSSNQTGRFAAGIGLR